MASLKVSVMLCETSEALSCVHTCTVTDENIALQFGSYNPVSKPPFFTESVYL